MKLSIIRHMLGTGKGVSSDDALRSASLKQAFQIAQANGYLPRRSKSDCRSAKVFNDVSHNNDRVPFFMPFISDKLSAAIRSCIYKFGLQNSLRLVEIPPPNLKQLLVRNRSHDQACVKADCIVCNSNKPGDCMCRGTVYLITCKMCGEEYIGETGRPLCLRINEHLDGMRKSRVSTPLGAHRKLSHRDMAFEISISVLSKETNIAARKAIEACWISCRCPKLNRKGEKIAVSNELAPFLQMCGFESDLTRKVHFITLNGE